MGSIHDGGRGSRNASLHERRASSFEEHARDLHDQPPARGERARCALAAAGLVAFEWRVASDEIGAARELIEWLGLAAPADGAGLRLADLLAAVHAADRAALECALRAAAPGARLDIAFRLTAGLRRLRLRAQASGASEPAVLVGVLEDLTEDARDNAARANLSQDELLSMFSHELRSPLNAILGWNRILSLKRQEDEEVVAVTTRIERSARAQLAMLNDLLDLSRMRRGRLRLVTRPARLARVVSAALEAARAGIAAKQIELAATLDEDTGEVLGDAERLQQLVGNLLSNSAKFTEAGGRIEVRLRALGAEAEISIADSGRGMTPEQLDSLFEEPRPRSEAASGLGIGLRLVNEIALLHGGAVRVASAGPGQGTTVSVRLPLLPKAGTAAAAPAPSRVPRLAGLAILVVDDESDTRTVVAESLRLEGARVRVCASAAAALEALCAPGAEFQVIVTDIGMPLEDGYSLVRKLRRLRRGDRVLAIALTGFASPIDRQRALQAGFDVHVPKPVEFEELVPLIARLAACKA